jgi:hypothetical protein
MRSAFALVLGFCFFAGSRPEVPRARQATITVDTPGVHAHFDGARLLSCPAIVASGAPIFQPITLPRAAVPVPSSTPVYLRQLVLRL